MHNQPREPQPYEDRQAKSIQEFGWTSQGMDWGWGQGIKSTTHRRVEEFGYSCLQRRLTWAKEKKNWTVAQRSKVLFSDESKFCISFGNQGPRVWRKGGEAHSISYLKSSVKFHSRWWFGCNAICWCRSIVFFENQRHCTRLPRNVGALHASFCWPAFDEKQETKKCRWAEGHCQRNLGFTPPQQCHKLITSMPRRIEAVIKAKWAPTKYWVHIQ